MIVLYNLHKTFQRGKNSVAALSGVNLEIPAGAWVTIIGSSGSGKSTLLYATAGLLKPSQGKVLIDGTDLYALTPAERALFRGRQIGIVFQSFHLFPHLTVIQNILMSGGRFRAGAAEAEPLLRRMGLWERRDHKPSELSVGEKQRTAMARAILSRPTILLADEPTGNLDSDNSRKVIEDLREINRAGTTVLFVTHRAVDEFRPFSTRLLRIEKGILNDA